MNKQYQNLSKLLIVTFLLFGVILIHLTSPMQSNAQSIFSKNLKPDPNDDEKLCNTSDGKLKDDKYCVYYRGYKASESTNKPLAADYRNKMLYVVKQQLDRYYDDYKNGRKIKTKWFQTILDILGIGLAFTGTVAGGERVKTVLGATSGSFQAGRNSVNDRFDLLKEKILINQMESSRLEQWLDILNNKGKDIDEFSWDNAKDKLQQYFLKGRFENALDTLVNETGGKVTAAENKLKILGEAPKTELTDKFENFTKYIRPMSATAMKLDADISSIGVVIAGMPAGQPKIDKQAEETALKAEKAALLDNYKNIWLAIEASGDFDEIDQRIQAKFGTFPVVIGRYNTFLTNFKTNPTAITTDDYDFIFTKVNAVVGGDEKLNKRFLEILKNNKL